MAKDAKLVEVTIFRGTYSTEAGDFGPGATVSVDAEEASWLKSRGFVKPDDYLAPEEVQDGGVKVTSTDGVNIGAAGG